MSLQQYCCPRRLGVLVESFGKRMKLSARVLLVGHLYHSIGSFLSAITIFDISGVLLMPV